MDIFSSLNRRKQRFEPLVAGRLSLYVCGMTVYDRCHLGHARVMLVFDMVQRVFEAQGYVVDYVRNITDIDDKIIERARANGQSEAELTDHFIAAMEQDERRLGLRCTHRAPRATAHISDMVAIIERLFERSLAYQSTPGGDVYFRVRRFPSYGQLSGRQLDELRSGERVEVASDKEDPLDFVLWKPAKPGEPQWPSPWGLGRPGWHIECSAMSRVCLGQPFDIHGGGQDLCFPHHDNEIAQSQGAFDDHLARYWMHNGFVTIDEEKMSKSLGNFWTVEELSQHFDDDRVCGEVLRLWVLKTHYRSPLGFSFEALIEARNALRKLYLAAASSGQSQSDHPLSQRFFEALNDDFNTPLALGVLFELAHQVQRQGQVDSMEAKLLRHLAEVLGLLQLEPGFFDRHMGINQKRERLDVSAIERSLEQRQQARQNRDFARADEIRAQLLAAGVVLEDGPGGSSWRRL